MSSRYKVSRIGGFCFLALLVGFISCRQRPPRNVRVLGDVYGLETASSRIPKITKKFLEQPVELHIGKRSMLKTYQEIGMKVDEAALKKKIQVLSHGFGMKEKVWAWISGDSSTVSIDLPVFVDTAKATQFLSNLKSNVDKSATEGHIDPTSGKISSGEGGMMLEVFDSLVVLKYEARRLSGGGKKEPIVFPVVEVAPVVEGPSFASEDFSVELAHYETRYPNAHSDTNRVANLKLGAEKIDGKILQPGETFSFNEVVGERTLKAGFRVAPEIGGGEYVDGVGGGMCQLASTLHAASFFAGLDILEATPHSRPSTYIAAGLDSTVYYPTKGNPKGKDLKIRNPYLFPVMVQFSIIRGIVKVTVMGKEKPYEAVEFQREVVAVIPPDPLSVVREDPKMPMDQEIQEQVSHEGYSIRRFRCFLAHGETQVVCPSKENESDAKPEMSCPKTKAQKNCWTATYQKVPAIVRKGTGPLTLKLVKQEKPHAIVGISNPETPLVIRQ